MRSEIGEAVRRLVAERASFNPRQQQWNAHFALRGALIDPVTAEGKVTARLLKLNLDKRIAERRILISVNRYPRA